MLDLMILKDCQKTAVVKNMEWKLGTISSLGRGGFLAQNISFGRSCSDLRHYNFATISISSMGLMTFFSHYLYTCGECYNSLTE